MLHAVTWLISFPKYTSNRQFLKLRGDTATPHVLPMAAGCSVGTFLCGLGNAAILVLPTVKHQFPSPVPYPCQEKAVKAASAGFANHAAEQSGPARAPDGEGRRTDGDGRRTETTPDSRGPPPPPAGRTNPGGGQDGRERQGKERTTTERRASQWRCQPGQTQHTGPHTKAGLTLMAKAPKRFRYRSSLPGSKSKKERYLASSDTNLNPSP